MPNRYGSFTDLCFQGTMAICNLFPPVAAPTCQLKKTGSISNLVNILLSSASISIILLITLRMSKKVAAVGRKEMMLLYWFLAVYFGLQMITTSNLLPSNSSHLMRLSAFELAWVFVTFFLLLYNGIVGFQLWRDGSKTSISLLLLASLGTVSGLTAYNLFKAQSYLSNEIDQTKDSLNDPTFYTLYVIWPVIASTGYLVLQMVLVIRSLSARKPLVFLIMALILIVSGEAIHSFGSTGLCLYTQSVIDGSSFKTIFLTFASLAIFKFWSDITEDDWDDFKLAV